MPAIAELYATVMPETSRIAEGITKAFREVDPVAREAGRRWGREIQSGMDDINVNLKADTAKAKAEIDKAAQDREATVEVDADTAKAAAQIDEAARDRHSTIHVDVDRDRFGQTMQNEVAQLGGRLSGAAASSGASIGSAMGGAMQPALLAAGITALAGIASSLSGLAGLAPAGLAGAGSLVATLAVGLDGVKDAWDAVGKAAESSGKDQEAKTKAVAAAQRSLKDAVLDEANAQKDVANARRDARQQLEDLNIQMRGGVIDEKQAILDARAARRDLATGRFRDAIEYEQAQARVEAADQRVLEAHERNVQLQGRAAEANAKGVEGSDQVVAAQQRLERAHENVAVAQQNLAEAQTKTSAAADSAAQAMAKLSPAAQAFMGTLMSMKPLWEGFKNSVQDALFKNMGPQIQQLASTYMPMLQGSFTTMASLINQAATSFMGFLQQPETIAMIQQLLTNITGSFQAFLPVMQTFGQAFLQMTVTGSAFLPQLGQIIGQLANMFAGFVNSGQFGKWMEIGLVALQQLTSMLPTVLQMLGDLAPIGTAALGGLGQILSALQPAIKPLADLFAAWVTNGLTPMLTLFAQIASTVIGGLAPAMTQWFQTMGPVANMLIQALQPALQTLGPVLAQTGQALLAALIPAVQQLIPVIVPLVQQVALWWQAMLPLLPSLMQLATNAIPPITDALTLLIPGLTTVLRIFTNLANDVIPPVSGALSRLADVYANVWDKIKQVTQTAWNVVKPIFDTFKSAIHDLHLDGVLGALSRFMPNLPNLAASTPTPGAVGSPNSGSPPATSGWGVAAPAATTPTLPTPGAAAGVTAPSGFDWDAVAKAESSGNWSDADSGHNGHYGGLQFSPQTWAAYGGLEFATRPDLATPEQQKTVADRTAFYGYRGTPPQGLGAWEVITKGSVPGITTSSRPPAMHGGLGGTVSGMGGVVTAVPTIPTTAVPTVPTTAIPGTGIPGLNLSIPGKAPEAHLQPGAVTLNRIISQLFPGVQSIGGWRENDPFPDHPSGRALDIMVGNDAALGNAINQYLQQHAAELGIDYTLWQQQQWTPGKGPSPMEDRGGATANHRDHVHAMVKAGAVANPQNLSMPGYYPSAMMPTGASPYGISADGTMPLGTQNSPMYVTPATGNSSAQQLGQDFLSGILEIFGLD
ncbi:transglycosylase family protein, partial [Mycobacterium asiaticum]|uniref:transglycosylase family protein n=1 Tax=Mycobacterium asiaticum TaxID=1790 RepID=UPI000AB07E9B